MSAYWQEIAFDPSEATSVRIYDRGAHAKEPPIVLYLAGGAFQSRAAPAEETPVARALAEGGAIVMEVDLGGWQENTFPGALDRAFAVLTGIRKRRRQYGGSKSTLFIAGDEAGGNVAAGLALKARDQMSGELRGQILLSPMIDPLMASGSIRDADRIGMRRRWSEGWSRYLHSARYMMHPYAAPCLCSRLAGVAPALLMTAEDDPLHDEVSAYSKRLAAAGVRVHLKVLPSGSGWTGIYRNEEGAWLDAVRDAFAAFSDEVAH